MYSNNKGKQQVQWLKSAVVNLPKILSRFSFRDTKEFATETKQSVSNVCLHVFKIVRWLKRACNILDRSSILIHLAVKKDFSPVALVAGLMWTNLQTTMTLSINCRSTVFRSWALLKMSWKQHKGTPKWALEMYLIEQQGWWPPCRCWTLMTNCLPLWKYLLHWMFLFIFKFLFFAWDLGGLKPPRLCRPWDIVKRKLMLVSTRTRRDSRDFDQKQLNGQFCESFTAVHCIPVKFLLQWLESLCS